jgi:hypothetical protein
MSPIQEAKKRLQTRYRRVQGFVGVGISRRDNRDVLHVYVRDATSLAATQLTGAPQFDGFPVEVEVLGRIRASQP